ncbi:MAG: CDP-glycerol glycerophosphotransferase family protein [Desulfuromonadales bacterium]|nr:CDP-glycerol glycerophosphotransferase family protein [Desulfuromonadales bacterium]
MLILFDVQEFYYLPQYLPVVRVLRERGCECRLVVYRNSDFHELYQQAIAAEDVPVEWVADSDEALVCYLRQKADWVVFGNRFARVEQLHKVSRSAQLGHGVGPKRSYYTKSSLPMTVRFVEGEGRYALIRQMYPGDNFVKTGFAKLDRAFRGEEPGFDLAANGLDPSRKTILYAPTFYPSSLECFPDRFPEDLPDCNIIIKPHFFSLVKKRYARQRRKLELWQKYPHVYLAGMAEQSLVPFMVTADLLISEASSALFEFAALDKPIVWCDFLKLRWTYRGPLRYRFDRRMDPDILNYRDLGAHAARYRELPRVVAGQLAEPGMFAEKRREYSDALVGTTDGRAAERIAAYLMEHGSD